MGCLEEAGISCNLLCGLFEVLNFDVLVPRLHPSRAAVLIDDTQMTSRSVVSSLLKISS
jgi:hypothetical protein